MGRGRGRRRWETCEERGRESGDWGKWRRKREHKPITSQMKSLPLLILQHTIHNIPIPHPNLLQQPHQILRIKMPIRTPMTLPRPRLMLRQYLLATKRRIPIAPPIPITSHIAIHVSYIVSVFFIEDFVGDFVE